MTSLASPRPGDASEESGRLFSAAEFRRRAAAQSGPFETGDWGDHRINPDFGETLYGSALRDAAVLIALTARNGQAPSIILTRRTASLRTHSGQIALPGGRIDAGDDGPADAALREAEEEIALPRAAVEIVGRLPDYRTGSGFRIAPILAIAERPPALVPEPNEVAEIFEVPLAFLMSDVNHRKESRHWQGVMRHYWLMPYDDRHHVWGVTAGILRMLYERLYA